MGLYDLDVDDVDLVTLLSTGMTNDEIAGRLRLTAAAVDRRTARLLSKLGFDSKAELIHAAALDLI